MRLRNVYWLFFGILLLGSFTSAHAEYGSGDVYFDDFGAYPINPDGVPIHSRIVHPEEDYRPGHFRPEPPKEMTPEEVEKAWTDFRTGMDNWANDLIQREDAWKKGLVDQRKYESAAFLINQEYQIRVDYVGILKSWYLKNYDPKKKNISALKKQFDYTWTTKEIPRRRLAMAKIEAEARAHPPRRRGKETTIDDLQD